MPAAAGERYDVVARDAPFRELTAVGAAAAVPVHQPLPVSLRHADAVDVVALARPADVEQVRQDAAVARCPAHGPLPVLRQARERAVLLVDPGRRVVLPTGSARAPLVALLPELVLPPPVALGGTAQRVATDRGERLEADRADPSCLRDGAAVVAPGGVVVPGAAPALQPARRAGPVVVYASGPGRVVAFTLRPERLLAGLAPDGLVAPCADVRAAVQAPPGILRHVGPSWFGSATPRDGCNRRRGLFRFERRSSHGGMTSSRPIAAADVRWTISPLPRADASGRRSPPARSAPA